MQMSQFSQPQTVDPDWQLLEPYFAPLKNTEGLSIQDLRAGVAGLIHAMDEAIPTLSDGLDVQERDISMEDGASIKLRTYVPHILNEEEKDGFPLLCWHLGGGFCTGTLDDDDKRLRRLALTLRITCTSVAYRLAPEFGYPIPVNDSFSALKWALSNTEILSVNAHKGVLIGGFSAGANITCAVVQRALKDDSIRPKIRGQILINPAVLASSAVVPDKWKDRLASIEQQGEGPILTKAHLNLFYNLYLVTDPVNLSNNTEVSPLLIPSFTGNPPTYIQICGCDPLRDEGVLYNELLQEAGVSTKVHL
ncbi:hypothetical protein Clacol_007103 [Clathrus columnatus]|uniref:Alpha/beta hydrolase fold-3 domain-containing protein n=1 Tax=Clathrus columnatus TaxID=1419009 RepID=A0AAV5AH89_9AGAM|nr:hypothetical protein Clacol_007103 [Clathrus columnatus]